MKPDRQSVESWVLERLRKAIERNIGIKKSMSNKRFKFRIWNYRDNCFMYEEPYHPNTVSGSGYNLENNTSYWFRPNANVFGPLSKIEMFHFDDSTIVQQFTGLKDKNGKEVYEGDIVKINRAYTRPFVNEKGQIDYKLIDDGEVEVGQVMWGWNCQKYIVSYEHTRYDDSEDFDKSSQRVEVIGNILENPDLLINEQ